MITNSDQDILLQTEHQVKAIERFRKDLEQVFRQQIAKHDLMKDGGFSFPIYTQAQCEDGGVYQYNYMTYFGLDYWYWNKEQQEEQIQLQLDQALKNIISQMIKVGCDLKTLNPKSTEISLYDN